MAKKPNASRPSRSKPRPFSSRLRRLADLIDAGKSVVTRFSESTSNDGCYTDSEKRTLKISVDVPEHSVLDEFV